jgi:hypothetical protein
MDGLVEELFRLEALKQKALTLVDAQAYDASVREQLRLIASSSPLNTEATNVERLLALSQLIRLNTRLLRNLVSTAPQSGNSYTAAGHISDSSAQGRLSMEA